MDEILADAGRAALKAFVSMFLVAWIGFGEQPNLDGAKALGLGLLVALIAAAVAALQVIAPQLSLRAHLPEPYGALADAFIHAFFAAFIVSLVNWLAEPDLAAWKSLVIGAVVGAINAGIRAVQGLLTPGEKPAPQRGVKKWARADGYRLAPA